MWPCESYSSVRDGADIVFISVPEGGIPVSDYVQLLEAVRREATGDDEEAIGPHPFLFTIQGYVRGRISLPWIAAPAGLSSYSVLPIYRERVDRTRVDSYLGEWLVRGHVPTEL